MPSTQTRRPRIYLAGPEVFLHDAVEAGARKQKLCDEAGFIGVYPLDAALDLGGMAKHAQAKLISESDEALMLSCDLLIANLTPFRGISADVGTAFEVGFMRALGRPVLGYSNTSQTYQARSEQFRAGPKLPFDSDAPGIMAEEFGLSENLMIEIAIEASGSRLITREAAPGMEMTDLAGFRDCLAEARKMLGEGRVPVC
ncbi:MAG: nucleoside 2-deoxyribosyltransferase [Hyphomicrobiaceae bacterium]